MEKFKVKLKVICTFWRRNAFCGGIIVIPPGNSRTWKKDVFPNSDVVKCSVVCLITNDWKYDLIMLRPVRGMVESGLYGKTAKTVFDQFDRPKGKIEMITTCCEEKMSMMQQFDRSMMKCRRTWELGTPISSYISFFRFPILWLTSATDLCSLKLAIISAGKMQTSVLVYLKIKPDKNLLDLVQTYWHRMNWNAE